MDNISMVEGGAGPCFAVKTIESRRIVLQFLSHQLNRNHPLKNGIERAVNFAMATRGDFASQFELAQLHRHHDWVAAAFAGFGSQGREVPRDKDLGFASAAGDHFQRFFTRTHYVSIVALPTPATSSH